MSSEGACPFHPAIRLRRYNRRTGEWKTLLETCPLCASGLPASSSSTGGGGAFDDADDDGTVSSRSSRFSRTSRPAREAVSCGYDRERNSGFLDRDHGHANPDDRSTFSAASGHTGATGATDSKSLSSMSTRKQRNSVKGPGGRDDYATDDDVGYKTEDHDSDTDMDSSNRSSLSRGVRFEPGTKEGSELGTDLDSDGSDVEDRHYHQASTHNSNYDPYDDRDVDEDADKNNTSYNSNNELNNFMMKDMEKRTSASSQYSNTPSTKAPLPSALRPSSFGAANQDVAAGSIVVYDGHKTSDHNSSLSSLHDDRMQPQHQYPIEKQKYRPPPPPRREEDHSPGESAALSHAITPATNDRNNRSASRSRNERSASRSRDVRPAPPQRAASQPRSSSRGRGTSITRGRDSSRSRPREEESPQPVTTNNGKHAPPPGRSRSTSRQPSRSRGREDRQSSMTPQQPQPPVGILKNGIRNNVSSTPSYNPKEAKDHEEMLDNVYHDDNNAKAHAKHARQPLPPPRSSRMSPPPSNNRNRMRMEPPETPQEELDNYSTHSRDSARRHMAPPRANIPPPNQPGDQPRGNPQDPRRRLSESSGQHPSGINRVPQPPRSGPMYLQNDHRDNASTSSYENRSQDKAPPRPRGMPSAADRVVTGHEQLQPRPAKNTPKKNRRSVDSQPGLTESETNVSDTPSANAEHNDSETPVMAQASAYDDKGRCVKHPHIKLRKRKLLGGWKVMLVNCPDCCIEEMLKMRRNGPGRAGQSDAKGGKVKRSPSEDSHSSAAAMPPISQLTIRNKNDDDQSSSSGSASEITYGTKTDYSRSSAMGSWHQYGPAGHNNPNVSADNSGSGSGPHRVTRMPFTDAYGHKGWYTGEVASGSGLPHGKGTMHYCDGRMRGGLWSNGLAAAGGGGGSGGAPNKLGSKSMGSGNSVSSQHSHHSRNDHPPASIDRESVVVGMEWMDLNGRCGFFTGETDEQRKPHGMGSMRYNDGKVLEGEWHHGEFDRLGGRGDGSIKSGRSRSRGTAF